MSQRSSGGKSRLFGISKRGDRYLRTLLIHGARAVFGKAHGKDDPRSQWIGRMRERRHPNIVAVALANKNARIVWSVLAHGDECRPAQAAMLAEPAIQQSKDGGHQRNIAATWLGMVKGSLPSLPEPDLWASTATADVI